MHFHAVIRLDGRHPDPDSHELATPPVWATHQLLDAAIRSAAAAVRLEFPASTPAQTRVLTWGEQVDVRPIAAFGPDQAITEQAVAAYVAKYATKAAEASGTVDHRVYASDLARLAALGVTAHAAELIRTCWELGNAEHHPELAGLKLRRWAHMLGFRGHFSTKSRAYSTTLGALRQARADYRATQSRERLGLPEDDTTLVLAHWAYAGQGFTPSEAALAAVLDDNAFPPRRTPKGEQSCLAC